MNDEAKIRAKAKVAIAIALSLLPMVPEKKELPKEATKVVETRPFVKAPGITQTTTAPRVAGQSTSYRGPVPFGVRTYIPASAGKNGITENCRTG